MARKKKEETKTPPKRPIRWFDEEVAEIYRQTYESVANSGNEITGEARRLMLELMEECSVTELEAVNILYGNNNVKDYLAKYARQRYEYDKYVEEREAMYGRKREN